MRPIHPLIAVLFAAAFLLPVGLAAAEPARRLGYNRDVRPILAANCLSCHGPDSAARQADLRLDRFADATAARDNASPAIVPGNAAGSELVKRIRSKDADDVIPPPASHKSLTAEQQVVLEAWINQGADYEPHWSLIPPVLPRIPRASEAEAWGRNPIDRFVLARLRDAGLEPAPEADRATLLRRVSLDLTGLPPWPELIQEFLSDNSPDAYERIVDRLLASPTWGEHRGRYWLDAARYADTHGIHFDNYREMWSYRDWVIRAFNRNQPFDQFSIEQLAGDLLPGATLDQRIASGFNRCNITTNEGGVIPEEYAVLYARDRTETFAQVWLGLTAGCSVCHDHKFDPLSQKEFYELSAFFNNTTQDPKDGNIKDTPPVIVVPVEQDRERWGRLKPELQEARAAVAARRMVARADFDRWAAAPSLEVLDTLADRDLLFRAAFHESHGDVATLNLAGETVQHGLAGPVEWSNDRKQPGLIVTKPQVIDRKVVNREGDEPFTCAAWIRLDEDSGDGAICAQTDEDNRMRGWDFWSSDRRLGTHLIHAWPTDAIRVICRKQIPAGKWTHVTVTYDGSRTAGGVRIYYDGVSQLVTTDQDRLRGTIRTDRPLTLGARGREGALPGVGLRDLRFSSRELPPAEITTLARSSELREVFAKSAEARSESESSMIYDWWLGALDESFLAASARVAVLEAEQNAIRGRGEIAHVMQEKPEPARAFVLYRGEYDKRRDEVRPTTPAVLPSFSTATPSRLELAHWLFRPDHPLTARVAVNRYWQELFGTGLVATSGDFGTTGELPSHPELLDWLAIHFREDGWDVKDLFRLMVTSSTYRQSAVTTARKRELDRDNRLLSRGPRFRMDAEMIRDSALAAGGLLSSTMGGPSVKPYQPAGVWEAVAMIGSNTRFYEPDEGENLYRRSVYTFWKRSAPPAQMEIFNAPSRESCVVRRERTNTPLQALVTLNDEQFVEAARGLAEAALERPGGSDESRLEILSSRAVGRPWTTDEQAVLKRTLKSLRAHYREHRDAAESLVKVGQGGKSGQNLSELAAWTMLANQVLNLDEFFMK